MAEREVDQPNPARVVADAAVLAEDLFIDGDARKALDHVRRHDWVELVASDHLLERTERLVTALADADLAAAHRERLEAERVAVEHPPRRHVALKREAKLTRCRQCCGEGLLDCRARSDRRSVE